ncbi:hypothetical protein [Spiroplasma endosymbiont of Seladonia tumulorum]|uniref:hypothetical protein n=1 Tax=Spiroplasma endosymbiont of Seladonia tumulorum TaxID=3066321 RepID=UPI0030D27072|nr:MAG: hypothetical protein OHM57_12125 [Spiroplasma phoeniceum]UZQ31034.1 MAG: hypothetical protein OHM57_05365 [Spiroplasma phoeniceum]UZQ32356.1 MAG: hypothetical protein OHM56_12690 [Spiroplasma phoeniceum]UZQ33463.1 MAG: hypothetical protein OHM56_05960 [Spiroplasma phoeniceum]
MTITESIKFNKLKEENETLKKELAEKEQEINSFKQQIDMAHNFNQNLGSEIEELKQQQLYKEDFYKNPYSTGSIDWILVDSSKYDKLSNKDVK